MAGPAGRLSGTRAVITGASRGLGRAVAEAFAAEGAADLVLTATREEHLESAGERCHALGARVTPLAVDLRDPAAAAEAGRRAVATLGRVDVLVNNAGLLGVKAPLAELPIEVLRDVLDVSVVGTLALTQPVLDAMPPGAVVINVTSGAAGRPGWGAYAVSRLAVEAMTQMLRSELAEREIRCVAINPGPTRTRMRAQAHPEEEPATVPHPSARVAPFVAVAAGEDPGWRIEGAEWS